MVRPNPFSDQQPERGDVVLLVTSDGERRVLKRIVGLGGETIEERAGQVLVDGEPLNEPWPTLRTPSMAEGWGPVPIPEGHVFVLGDNREQSNDSRHFGPVEEGALLGLALYVSWSFDINRLGEDLRAFSPSDI